MVRKIYDISSRCKRSRKISFVRLPKKFLKFQVPGTEMKFIAVKD